MVDAKDLAIVKSSPYRMEVAVAQLAMAAGLPAAKALEDMYKLGQRSVVDDPQRFGLVGLPC